jgi:4-hydroxyphenylpyruvate dioxygenase
MEIDHVHFYVEDAPSWRDWCCYTLGFRPQGSWQTPQTQVEVMVQGDVTFVCSAPLHVESPVAQYLQLHPPGVADLAFRVNNLQDCLQRVRKAGAKILQTNQNDHWLEGWSQSGLQGQLLGHIGFAQIQGWGSLRHTLVQCQTSVQLQASRLVNPSSGSIPHLTHIDHAVLNVAASEFAAAMNWYEKVLGFQRQQRFEIQTRHSGLCSQVLIHPDGGAQLPVNAPTGETSQIQEFLDWHRGAGIQHLALHSPDLLAATQGLRQRGLPLLATPASYYQQLAQALNQHPGQYDLDIESLAQAQILADWQVEPKGSVLLQIFSQPIFGQPTFFLEFIERRQQAQGFGEGNFLALFEAIEREQLQRDCLVLPT